MIAEKEDSVKGLVETLHHVQGFVLAAQQRSSAMQQIRLQIAHAAMGIIDKKTICSGVGCPIDGRIHLSKKESSTKWIIVAADHDLVPVDDASNTLEIS